MHKVLNSRPSRVSIPTSFPHKFKHLKRSEKRRAELHNEQEACVHKDLWLPLGTSNLLLCKSEEGGQRAESLCAES